MLEPPSAPLIQLLRELRLCTQLDLRRCRGRVRRMATDLPAFDSVWIDALVQMRKLTPFQAQTLESTDPKRLRVGPCVLVERLGGGFNGTTYLARTISSRQLRVIKVVRAHEESIAETLSRAQALLAQSAKVAHPSIVVPRACERIDQSLVFVSRYVPGRTLTEFLVRRGRYPARIVWQIGRQLAEGLVKLHAAGLAHGDIRPSQVRILTEGTAVLVDSGIQPVMEPELSPHSQLTPECYDCVAPELIGTGIAHNPASDLYALGCLLWQLLAGRPPFPGGDPLQKLASHQTRRIRDVRDFAPDTPAPLADMILRLTSPNVSDRPANAAAVLKSWGPPRRSGRSQLKQFVSSFQHPIEAAFRVSSLASSPVAWLMAFLFCALALTVGMSHDGARANLLRIWAQLPNGIPSPSGTSVAQDSSGNSSLNGQDGTNGDPDVSITETLQTIPEPNAQGIIELLNRGPYAARKISQVGLLEIRASTGVTAEIVVQDQPLFLNAAKVVLNGLQLRRASIDSSAATLKSLVQAETLELEVRNSQFLTSPIADSTVDPKQFQVRQAGPVALSWKVTEATSPQSGFGVFENLVFLGNSPGLELQSSARQIVMQNVLRLGAGSLVSVTTPISGAFDLKLKMEHVTSRQSGSVFRWEVADQKPSRQHLRIEAKDCVFDVLSGQGGLLEFAGKQHVSQWAKRVQFLGDVCLASEHSEIAICSTLKTREIILVDSSELELEGVTQGAFTFLGDFSLIPTNSAIRNDYNGIRSKTGLPGVVARLLPGNLVGLRPLAALPTLLRMP